MPNYRMQKSGTKAAEILIYDEIGPGGFFSSGISAKQFADDLKELGKVETLNVRMNSPGGDVFDGLAIYNTLKRHPATVIVDVDGMALSIASVIAMAGDEINMAANAMMMIHDPWTVALGSADDFRAKADLLDTMKGNLVSTYAARTKLDDEVIADLMSQETWMTAEEAKQRGFADAVTEELAVAAKFDPARFKNVPRGVRPAADSQPGLNARRAQIAALSKRLK